MPIDIVIIGGGVIGSSIAHFLNAADSSPNIVVVEPDPLYELAATPRASGGVRQLFSLPENIMMSRWSLDFYRNFSTHVAAGADSVEIGFKQYGYLFLVPESGEPALAQAYDTQLKHGVEVEWLTPDTLGSRYPCLNLDGIAAATFSPQDGCIDPNAALQGFKRRARTGGVKYLQDRVVGMTRKGDAVTAVELASGTTLEPAIVVNAAGTWSSEISAMIGQELPVEPMRRFDHYFECATAIEPLPFIKDTAGLGMHPEGQGYAGSVVNHAEPAGHNFTVDHEYFENVVWPHLAHRIPAFEALRLKSSWVGHYDRNRLDGNMVLGNWAPKASNFYVACGFSGHGLMHAPAVGRAMAELIMAGGYQTLDLSRMDYQRIARWQPYPEIGIR